MADAPSRLIGHAKRALEFLAAHAVARRDKEVDRIEPRLKRRAAVLKDRAGAGVDVIAAGGAGEGPASGDLVKGALNAAFAADVAKAIADLHDSRQASIVVLELREEVADRKCLDVAFALCGFRRAGAFTSRHLHSSNDGNYAISSYLRQGDNPLILRIIIIEAAYYGDEHSIFYSTAEFVIKVPAVGLTVYFLAVCISMAATGRLKHESAGATTISACAAAGLLYVALTTSPAKIHWLIHQSQFNEAIGEMPQSKERLRLEILAVKNIDDAPFLPAALDYYVGRSMLIFDSSDQIASPSRSQEWVDAMRAKSGIAANPECHWSIEKIDLHVYAVDAFC